MRSTAENNAEGASSQRQLDEDVEEVNSLLKQIEIGSRSMPPSDKSVWRQKVKTIRSELTEIQGRVLMASSNSSRTNASNQNSQTDSHASHQRNMDRLEESRRQLAETEAVAVDTTASLHAQRNQMDNVRKNVNEIDSQMSHTDRILTRMSKWWRG